MVFTSPTYGELSMVEVAKRINYYIKQEKQYPYKVIVGTDSQVKEETIFVTAIIVHRVGKGAIYFYSKESNNTFKDFRQRILNETNMSLETASELKKYLCEIDESNLEIHVDIGNEGRSRELIKEIVGWVMGVGYKIMIKPDSHGASKVADRYTR